MRTLPTHCRVCNQQTAACQLCADGFILRDGACVALTATAWFADHAGMCLACGVGAHSVTSSSDDSVCDVCKEAHCVQCPLNECYVCDVTNGFFLNTTTHTCTNNASAASVSNAGVVSCAP